jgi:anionic cell wall polymer biosynthesis LytR-Cps2A-Psr (LCP) family protein
MRANMKGTDGRGHLLYELSTTSTWNVSTSHTTKSSGKDKPLVKSRINLGCIIHTQGLYLYMNEKYWHGLTQIHKSHTKGQWILKSIYIHILTNNLLQNTNICPSIGLATKTYTYHSPDMNTCNWISLWYSHYGPSTHTTSATNFMISTTARIKKILIDLIIHLHFIYACLM